MRIFSISDLHLPGNADKPMDIFGAQWENHWDKIKSNWREMVDEEDCVLIPGDISWAMKLEDAIGDLEEIGQLPGSKIIIRGNHDFWWSSISKVRRALPQSIYALQNDSIKIGKVAFCGTRGWTAPGSKDFTDHDQKIFNREVNRLRLSLESAKEAEYIIVLLHYPPFDDKGEPTELCKLMEQYPVKHVVYGHLHGEASKRRVEGEIEGIQYHLTSCDFLNFCPKIVTKV